VNVMMDSPAAVAARAKTRRNTNTFIALWTLAVFAAVSAFVVHLSLRGRTVALGYELGRARSEQTRLLEMRRVLELEAASYKTPARVENVARTLLGMEQAPPERIISLRAEMPISLEGQPESALNEPVVTATVKTGSASP
jgi:cell division protein FtsL